MLKVFLVEDECLVREGIRDNIPWNDLGFEFAGEATDGEMALPLIRKIQPDLLITDIRMPFMDGLDLAGLVSKELPGTRIIIISGYDDFEYARTAITLGVDQYLLKPITKAQMLTTLENVKDKFDREREQQDYLAKFKTESQEYEQFTHRKFFEQLVEGTMTVNEIFKRAAELDIRLDAAGYNIVLFMLQPEVLAGSYSEDMAKLKDNLMREMSSDRSYLLFRWNLMSYAVLVKADSKSVEEAGTECLELINKRCGNVSFPLEWYAAIGEPVERLSAIPQSFAVASHRLAMRHLAPHEHIIGFDAPKSNASQLQGGGEDRGGIPDINSIDVGMVDPMVIRSFLQTGLEEEIDDFVEDYLNNLGSAVDSLMFRQYILLSVRFNAAITVKSFGHDQDEFLRTLPDIVPDGKREDAARYMREIFSKSIALRDSESRNRFSAMMREATEFINENYDDYELSLNTVARAVNVSANYFSAVFSQEQGQTFVEYLTSKRMDKARELLRTTSMRSGEIAEAVGYRDPRYFSFIFKKTTGCTPRDYRAGK